MSLLRDWQPVMQLQNLFTPSLSLTFSPSHFPSLGLCLSTDQTLTFVSLSSSASFSPSLSELRPVHDWKWQCHFSWCFEVSSQALQVGFSVCPINEQCAPKMTNNHPCDMPYTLPTCLRYACHWRGWKAFVPCCLHPRVHLAVMMYLASCDTKCIIGWGFLYFESYVS